MRRSIIMYCIPAFLVLGGLNFCAIPQNLSESEIIEDLATFQEGLEERFAYLKTNKADYKKAIAAIRKKAKNGMSVNDFGIELTRVLALFIDGHASISGFRQPEGFLPFLIEPVKKRFVAFLPDRSGLLDAGYPYIQEMDGKVMKDWIDAAGCLVPKGSPQYVTRHCLRKLRYIQFMRGELGLTTGSPLIVKLISDDGKKTKTMTFDVSGRFPTYGAWPPDRTRILDDNIAYLRIPSMNDEAVDEIHDWMPKFSDTAGLIVDVRDNGGGSREALLALFPYLMNKDDPPLVANAAAYRLFRRHEKDHLEARFMYREDWGGFSKEEKKSIKKFKSRFKPEWRLPRGEFSEWHYLVLSRKEAPGLYHYEKPVVILMNEKCFSATDIFLGALKGWRNVTLVGRPSGGGSARKQGFSLRNSDLRINVASMASFQKSGKLFDGHGVEPDAHIEPLPEYFIRGGQDNILEKALKIISGSAPHPMNIVQDEAKFIYYQNGHALGTSESRWDGDGTFENRSELRIGGQRQKGMVLIHAGAGGRWTSITMMTVKGVAEMEREGSTIKMSVGGKMRTIELKPGTFLMEDMSPALMSQAISAYDEEKAGVQKIPLYFLPIVSTEGSLELLESFDRVVDSRQQTFRKFHFTMPPVYTVRVVVNQDNRVCLAEYPAQHGVFVRDGYDALNVSRESDPLLSKPRYEVKLEDEMDVPMRDGVLLATDIYRPDAEGRFPVILVRTPYKKEMGELRAHIFTPRGYVFAIQDVRGRFASPGEWKPFVHEADDGYDTVEWLARQPWSNGKVGMIGGSYLGWVQWWAASRHPPHLVTMIPNVSPPEPYFNFPYECGAFVLSTALWWISIVDSEATADLSGMAMMESFEKLDREKLMHLPVIELDEVIFGEKSPHYREWVSHPDLDGYWKGLNYLDALSDIDIPIYHQSGWFDGDGIGSKLNHLGMSRHGHAYQKLVLGPWGHTDTDTRYLNERHDFGPNAIVDLQTSYIRWMDRWLKGIDNGIDREPLVSLFVMGTNDWLHGNTYPLEATHLTKYYLAGARDSGGDDGSGLLTTEQPSPGDSPCESYVYDPGDPAGTNPEDRDDVLMFKTPPLEKDLTLAGPVSGVLHAASSARDTDWIMRLAKLDTRGRPLVLGTGVLRARYRKSYSDPELIEPGTIYAYTIDLWHTGVTCRKGERLVLVVCSAYFPRFSRNLNTGGNNLTGTDFIKAEQTIYHDPEHPSHILLPVIPNPQFGKKPNEKKAMDKKTSESPPPLSNFGTAYEAAAIVKLPEKAPENHPTLHNVFRLSENIVSGSEPEGKDGLEQVAAMGVKTILSVDGKAPDAETAKRLGMKYVHVPIQYRGVDDGEMDRIAKTFREMEGPFYVHCFHGKHRGPAAAAIGRIVVDGISREQALAEMRQWCGTSKKYEGLYLTVAQDSIPSKERTENFAWDFPPSHPFKGFRHLMVEISRPFDHLKTLSRRGWQLDPQHPDIDAVNEAEKLAAFFKEGIILEEVGANPDDFQRWMLESMEAGHILRERLVRFGAKETGAKEKAMRAFDDIGELCTRCHSSYRNK